MNTMCVNWCLSGEIKSGYLVLDNENRLKIRNPNQQPTADSVGVWRCVPSTDSTGQVVSIAIVEEFAAMEPSFCVGRVTVCTKRGTILVKISPSRKIYFHCSSKLHAGYIYKLEFEYRDSGLHVTTATKLDTSIAEDPSVESVELAAPAAIPSLPTEIAKSPLFAAPSELPAQSSVKMLAIPEPEQSLTLDQRWRLKLEPLIYSQFPNFKITNFTTKNSVLEWEGESDTSTVSRIQGAVGSMNLSVHSWSSNSVIDSDEVISKPDFLRVTPLGAALSIGASCFKVEIGDYEIVLDAGTRPKGSKPLPAFELLENPNLILISHAHQDHIGALPVLHRMFPSAPTICTPGTRLIAQVMLSDCLKVSQKNEDFEELFDEIDLDEALFRLETQPIGVEFHPLPGLTVKFINAGHIVGAACIYIQYGNRSLLYTGNYNTTNSRTTTGLKLNDLPKSDILITEATYGASTHPSRKQQEGELVQAVWDIVSAGGNVLIPAFALGRAQEIILALKTSEKFTSCKIPIYIDGLVRSVTDVFSDNLNLLPESVRNRNRNSGIEPFCDGRTVIPISDRAQRPLAMASPSVIIASSGMLTGGASVYYAEVLLERENAAIFISGYTDEESPGRMLQSMRSGEVVTVAEREITVRAQIRRFNLSAHPDRLGIGSVIAAVKPRHLILVHGSPSNLRDLASGVQKNYIVHIPRVGDKIEYGVFPKQLGELAKVELSHPSEIELEIVAERDGAWIRVPQDVVENDPRYASLSQSGTVRAKWHHSTLMLLPVTRQYDALEKAKAMDGDCCAKCWSFKDNVCSSPESPLSQLNVDPSGVCGEFVSS
ncbi:MAG: MBL fold metallo-hydrolase [Nostocaceae cyanobacterium]|nr:MBL fold metallo-hydrolase [Nostocaceae cyanobacterium]